MPEVARHLVGREEEVGAIVGALDDPAGLPLALALAGEAGVGKTTLWLAGVEAAAERGYRVLQARPAEVEARFSFAGLADLLDGVAEEVLPDLPTVQRRALESALLLGEEVAVADERAVAAALLGAIRAVARRSRVCLAVDDVQWLDEASLTALGYALARLADEPAVGLFAARGAVPAWLGRAVVENRFRAIELQGLSLGAVHELLRSRLGAAFPRPVLIRLWETSRGNPLFALELARALQRRGGTLAVGEELPIPTDLDELLRARLGGLGPAALEVARVVAALADATLTLVERAAGRRFEGGLDEALGAAILEVDGERLRFTHPLLRSAMAARQTPAALRSLHLRLAALVPAAEEQARHLALATTAPDGAIAAVLEEAARTAHARGAPAAAAELAESALVLTPSADVGDARRRLFLAAERHHVAGDHARAIGLLEGALEQTPAGPGRAAILVRLGDVAWDSDPRQAERLYGQALDECTGDDALEATIHLRHADLMHWGAGIEGGLAHARRAVHAAARAADVELTAGALAAQANWQFRAGRGLAHEAMEEAVGLERSLPLRPLVGGPIEWYCMNLFWADELDRARALLLELLDARRAQGDAGSEAWALWLLGMVEWRAGNWDEADRHTNRAHDLRALLGSSMITEQFPAAILAAHRGDVDRARMLARTSIARGQAHRVRIEESGHNWVLGFVELSLGEPGAALAHLRRAYRIRDAFMLEPAQRLELGDLLEALIGAGALDEAEQVLATWERRATELDRAWALAVLSRARGLLLAARGELESSFASFEAALAQHARSDDPFNHARTLLALGRTQRRAKRRAAARATLEDALRRFELLGATLWVRQARAELARIGGRAPANSRLTEAEARIAALVAEGRSNRQVAAALFLTEHSVETALTRVYRKLGLRSRAELAGRYASNS